MNYADPPKSLLREGFVLASLGLKLCDALTIALTGTLAHWLRFGDADLLDPVHYLYAVLAGVLLASIVFTQFGVYRSWRQGSRVVAYGRVLFAWSAVLAILASLSFLSKTGADFSRLWFAYWAISGLAGLWIARVVARRVLDLAHRRGWGLRRVALMGTPDDASRLAAHINADSWSGFRVTVICSDLAVPDGQRLRGVAYATMPAVPSTVAQAGVDEVWLAWPLRDEDRIRRTLDQLQDLPLNIRWVPDIFSFRLINHGITEIAGVPMLDLSISPLTGLNRIVKSLEDYVLASIVLVVCAPLLAAIAVGVKLSSPGPVLFRQLRHGWDGAQIEVWKFRTMRVHREPEGSVTQAVRGDARVTRFGALLRRTSLDELPQFFNVLQGRMSIVGPRPHALAHNEHYKRLIPRYLLRHRVKPGITGWAQINGLRGETDTLDKMQRRVEYDLFYIEHWSLWFDLRIMWRTARQMLFDRSAY